MIIPSCPSKGIGAGILNIILVHYISPGQGCSCFNNLNFKYLVASWRAVYVFPGIHRSLVRQFHLNKMIITRFIIVRHKISSQ